jgi:hypothetical protein
VLIGPSRRQGRRTTAVLEVLASTEVLERLVTSADPTDRKLLVVARDVHRQLLVRYGSLGPSREN